MESQVHRVFSILAVEDNPGDFVLLQEVLRDAAGSQCKLTQAAQLGDAIQILDKQSYDLVLLDLDLPDSRGIDTFTRLRAHDPDCAIILLTGLDNEELGIEAVRSGAQNYLVKGSLDGKMLWRVISYSIERARLEKAVRESEKRYRRLLESVTDYVYTAKVSDKRVVSTSHGPGCVNVTGYTESEYEADPDLWYRMVYEDDREAVTTQAANVLAGNAVTLEHRIVHKSGSVRWVRNTPVAHLDERGRITSYDGLISDITERKTAEQALQEAILDLRRSQEELKTAQLQLINATKMETVGRLAAGVAHEVKNPLAIILMSVDFLSQRIAGSDETVASVLKDMRDAVHRADAIIRSLLDFSASETLALKPANLNQLIDKALMLVKHGVNLNHITVATQLDEMLPDVSVDASKMEQVFVNLLTNSIDAMPEGGSLTLRTRAERLEKVTRDPGTRMGDHFRVGDSVVIAEVEDTGSGISPEALDKIFDPFFTTKEAGKGTGLGLTVTKKIVDLHGGSLAIRDRPEGGVCATLMFKCLGGK
jgi:hypothetical protein